MRISIDSNILVYAIEPNDSRAVVARRIMAAAAIGDCVLTNQAIGEFFEIVRRKRVTTIAAARQVVADWQLLFPITPTTTDHLVTATRLVERYQLQFWDSVILAVSSEMDVKYLITEDMQDGAQIDGVTLINPFNPANAELLDLLLTPQP